jgi:hypothetical protein
VKRTEIAAAAITGLAMLWAPVPATAQRAWLCKPGIANDPCELSLRTTVISPSGQPLRTYAPRRADAGWGLHLVDANIALGNLVDVVRVQAFVHTLLSRFHH